MNYSLDKNDADPKDKNLEEKVNQPDLTTGGGLSQLEKDRQVNDEPFDPADPDFPGNDSRH